MMLTLDLIPLSTAEALLAPSTFDELSGSSLKEEVSVARINPDFKGGDDFCANYGVHRENGANCVILQASRADRKWFVAALIPVGCKMDIGGFVRRTVGARKLAVAPLQEVLDSTHMEYGSITVVGLPSDWVILVDSSIADKESVFIGSGRVESKLRVPGAFFRSKPYQLIAGLGIASA